MTKGFRVIESVLRGDEHLVFNLTVLSELHKIGLLNSFSAKTDILALYHNHLPLLDGLKARQKNLSESRVLFLTGSWLVLFKCLIIKGEKVIIFHNFYGFLENSSWRSIVKFYTYKTLIRLGRIKPVVLNNYIKSFVETKTNLHHGVIQIAYNLEIIEAVAPKDVMKNSIEIAIYGNLFPGKVNHTFLEFLEPKHFGKLHGGMKYKNSIDKYLSTKDYYNCMRATEKTCVLNNNNHRVASGVLADTIALGKRIICFEDRYLQNLVLQYNLECTRFGNYLEIDLEPLQDNMYKEFIKDLERL